MGIALSLHPVRAASDSEADRAAVRRHDGIRNRWFLDPLYGRGYPQDVWDLLGAAAPKVLAGDLATIAAPTDFLGINYYFPETVADAPRADLVQTRVVQREGVERTAFGWEVAPDGLRELLARVAADYRPPRIYITENGSTYDDAVEADGRIDDAARRSYLQRHLAVLRATVHSGVPVQGYFAWSLLDNFEWAEGYARRFGLVHVDFATQQRTLKLSGAWYRAFLRGSDIGSAASRA